MKLWEEWKQKADKKESELEKVYKLLEVQQEISDDLRKELIKQREINDGVIIKNQKMLKTLESIWVKSEICMGEVLKKSK